MNRLATFVTKRSKLALFGFIALIALSTIWGFQAFAGLKGGGYDDPKSDSAEVWNVLRDTFDSQESEVIGIADFGSAASETSNKLLVQSLLKEIDAVDGVVGTKSYYTLGEPQSLKSDDGKAVYFFVDLDDEATQATIAQELVNKFDGKFQTAEIHFAGFAAVTSELNESIKHDIVRAELIAVPITLILLTFVFGSLVAAGLPLLVGGLAILGSFFFMWISTQVTDTSIFSMNLITGLGLGLGIDYALLMVNRFREERKRGRAVDEAVRETVLTAGRTVVFSGLTVAVVLLALTVFPQYFLRSFALAGFVVVILAVLGAIIALPTLLNLLGDRVNRLRVLRGDLAPKDSGAWASLAKFVMKRPVSILLLTSLALGGLVALGGGVQFGQVDDRILPKDNRVVVANDMARERFSGREASPVEIIAIGATNDELLAYTSELSKLDAAIRVQSPLGITQDGVLDEGYSVAFAEYTVGDEQRIQVIHDVEPRSPEGVKLTKAVRAVGHDGFEVLVGGGAATYADSLAGIERNLPLAAAWIIFSTLVLLFMFTGSIILPIKAVLLNFASLGATLGFLTWVFMGGHLRWLIGDFTVTGTIDASTVVLIAVVAFGLSMDYELFLLSRIKEQHDAGKGTTESVAVGLQRSGRIITAAALVLAVTFAGFITSGVTIIKMLGLGIAFAILLDATVVRALLVPSLMRLFGELNWWAPKWMKKLQRRANLDH